MKLLRSFFPALLAVAWLLAPLALGADEKPDAGPLPTPEEKQAAEALAKRGALVESLAADLNWSYVNFRGIDKPDASAFALLGKMPSIVELDLSGMQFQPADLAGVASLKNLRKFSLSGSNASDAALANVKDLPQLESLSLFHTDVTDAGMQQLAGLKNLKRLYVFETKVTEAGATALAKALPNLRIERGWDVKLPPTAVPVAAPAVKPEPSKPPTPKPEPPKPEPPKVAAPSEPAALAPAKPEEVGMDSAKLAAIKHEMEELLKQKRGAGVVTLIVRDGRVVLQEAAGMANIEKRKPMTPDTIFWIASMTKSITATAAMILVDEGKLTLDEPASKWIPELAKVKVGDRPLARPITLRDLLSHTSGIPDPPRKPTDGSVPLARYALDLLEESFESQPGGKFEYGFGPTVAGRIVEVAGGKPFEQFVNERIITPLGMKDTTWHPDAAQCERMARTYKLAGDALVPAHNAFLTSDPDIQREAEPSGGLFSTAADMARFYQMVLNGGELDGKRIISAKAVSEMIKPHSVSDKPIQYGLGWFNNATEKKITPHMSDQSFGHGGAFGTHGWIDPEKKMVTVFMVQNVLVPKGDELRDKFMELAAGAVK